MQKTDFVREEHTLPTDQIERRDMIRWVLDHPVWTVPVWRNREGESECIKEIIPDNLDWLPHWGWERCISIEPVWVNPNTLKRDLDNDSLNTHFEVWIEAGPPHDMSKNEFATEKEWNDYNRWCSSHDLDLDCGANTLDEALLELALLVKHHYGDYSKEDDGWLKWHQTSEHGLLKK